MPETTPTGLSIIMSPLNFCNDVHVDDDDDDGSHKRVKGIGCYGIEGEKELIDGWMNIREEKMYQGHDF